MDLSKLNRMAKALRKLPLTVQRVAATKTAPDITSRARASFESGETVFGTARPTGVDGQALTLHRTGRLLSGVKFTAIGTRVRAVLSVFYARYNVKYGILPRGRGYMPVSWRESIKTIINDAIAAELK